jgi:hypothetical protein
LEKEKNVNIKKVFLKEDLFACNKIKRRLAFPSGEGAECNEADEV